MTVLSRYLTSKNTLYRRRLWNIGFVEFDADTIFKPLEIAWLEHAHTDGWFADPFIVQDDGERLEVLVEHFVYAENTGHIAKLSIRREGRRYRLEHVVPLIADGTHFSFPNIYRGDDGLFIYPENWERGTLDIYAYDSLRDRAQSVGTLYEAPLVDAVITQAFGRWRLFATREDRDPSGCELEVFVSETDDWSGPYMPETKCVFADRVARGGGQFFSIGDRLIRVGQDNNGVYGGGLVFFETHYDGREFSFTEIARHLPADKRYNLGLHTFNVYGSIAVVDGRGYAHPLRRVVDRIKRRLGKTKRIGAVDRPTVVA